jgi:hypothetical protein
MTTFVIVFGFYPDLRKSIVAFIAALFSLLFPNLNALKISAVQICNHYPARADALAMGFTSLSITSKKWLANIVQLVEGGTTRGTTALVSLQLQY